jgi:hypothetical protein
MLATTQGSLMARAPRDPAPIDYLEVHANALSRDRIRAALQYLQRRGLPVEYYENPGCWQSTFTVRSHPAVIRRLQKVLGRRAMPPSLLLGGNLNMVA